NQVYRVTEVHPTALLHAALQDLFAGTDGAGERGALLDCVRDRLFEVYIFAGGECIDGHVHVPVIWRGDQDGVELLFEEFAIVGVGGGVGGVGALFDGVATRGVDVADRGDLVGGDFVGGIHQIADAPAGADDSDAERVVGAEDAGRGEGGEAGGDDETTTIEFVGHSAGILARRGAETKWRVFVWRWRGCALFMLGFGACNCSCGARASGVCYDRPVASESASGISAW